MQRRIHLLTLCVVFARVILATKRRSRALPALRHSQHAKRLLECWEERGRHQVFSDFPVSMTAARQISEHGTQAEIINELDERRC